MGKDREREREMQLRGARTDGCRERETSEIAVGDVESWRKCVAAWAMQALGRDMFRGGGSEESVCDGSVTFAGSGERCLRLWVGKWLDS